MTSNNPNLIQVDAQSLNKVMHLLTALKDRWYIPESATAAAVEQLEQTIRDHTRVKYYPLDVKLGDIIQPKVGRNTLRAGTTAYGRAIVISMEPFQIVSTDNLFTWRDIKPTNFDVVGAVKGDVLERLIASWIASE